MFDFTPGAANTDRQRKEHSKLDLMLTHFEDKVERHTNEVEGVHLETEATRADHLNARADEARPEVARDEAKLAAAKRKTARKKEAFEAASKRQMERIQRKHHNEERLKDIRRTVAQTRDTRFVSAEVTYPDDDGDWRAVIARLEARWEEKRAKRSKVAGGPVPKEELLRPFHARVRPLQEQGRPAVEIIKGQLSVQLPTVPAPWEASTFASKENQIAPRTIDLEAIAYRYFGEDIMDDVEAAVDAIYADIDPATIMPAGERRKLVRELDAEIDRAGRELAATLWAAIEDGHDFDFPEELPTKAVLGIE